MGCIISVFQSVFSEYRGVIACDSLYTKIQAIAPPRNSSSKTTVFMSPAIGVIIVKKPSIVPTPSIKNLPDHISKVGTWPVARWFVFKKLAVLSIANDDNNENAANPITPVSIIFIAMFISRHHPLSQMNDASLKKSITSALNRDVNALSYYRFSSSCISCILRKKQLMPAPMHIHVPPILVLKDAMTLAVLSFVITL